MDKIVCNRTLMWNTRTPCRTSDASFSTCISISRTAAPSVLIVASYLRVIYVSLQITMYYTSFSHDINVFKDHYIYFILHYQGIQGQVNMKQGSGFHLLCNLWNIVKSSTKPYFCATRNILHLFFFRCMHRKRRIGAVQMQNIY